MEKLKNIIKAILNFLIPWILKFFTRLLTLWIIFAVILLIIWVINKNFVPELWTHIIDLLHIKNNTTILSMFLTVKYYMFILGVVLSHIFVDMVNDHLIDKYMHRPLINFLSKNKYIYMISQKLDLDTYLINATLTQGHNATVIPFSKIDDLVSKFYSSNKGKIYLFNIESSFFDTDNIIFKDIHSAIKRNANNIEEIILLINIETEDSVELIEKSKKLFGVNLKIVTNIPDNLKAYFKCYSAGIYTRGTEIEFYLHKPLYPPYNSKYSFIQVRKEMNKIAYKEGFAKYNLLHELATFVNELDKNS